MVSLESFLQWVYAARPIILYEQTDFRRTFSSVFRLYSDALTRYTKKAMEPLTSALVATTPKW